MRRAPRPCRLESVLPAAPDRTSRLRGHVLVLLALGNELRERRSPHWRVERNRLETDRAIAALAREGRRTTSAPWAN
jgi:hypothetical protein